MSDPILHPLELSHLLADEVAALEQGWHTPVMIWGAPGIGKSEVVARVAREQGLALIDLRLSQLEPSDLRGIPYRDGDRVVWAPPAALPDAARHGERGILFLDELTAALPTVAAAAYQLVLDRKLGDYCLPPGWLMVAAGNRPGDRGIAYAMPAPLANRFMHVWLEPEINQWLNWARAAGVDARLCDFLCAEPGWLSDFDPDEEAVAFASPRSWVFADRVLKKAGGAVSLPALKSRLAGCVGLPAAAALIAFMTRDQARLEQVWQCPEKAAGLDLPEQWALFEQWRQRVRDGRLDLDNALAIARALDDAAVALSAVKFLRAHYGEALYRHPEFAAFAAARADELVEWPDEN